MDTIGANLGEVFAKTAIQKYFEETIQDKITNKDYERYLTAGGASVIKVKTYGNLTMQTYARGSALNPDDPTESEAELNPDQQKAYYFEIDSLDTFEDYIKNPESELIKNAVGQLKEAVDAYILGLYADAGSGNRVGTDYTTGTVAVTVTTGAVAGTGTTFTSAMVGLGIKVTGHTSWYRIKTYTSATAIVIEDDSDDDTSAYTGGAISAGATYTIEAAAVKTVTVDNIYETLDSMAVCLSEKKIPKSQRWTVVPSRIGSVLRRSDELTLPVAAAYEDVIKRGLIGLAAGFQVYENEQVSGNNTTGYYCMGGHISAITFVMEYREALIESDITGEFGKRFKALWVYGAKVADERRKALAYMWVKR